MTGRNFARFAIHLLATGILVPSAIAQSVEAKIDASKSGPPISKYVYGQFVEHIGNIINNGLWAEMLDDRKFYNPIPTPTAAAVGGPRFARTRLRPWTVIGPKSTVSMDLAHPYVGKHSPKITVSADTPRGIEQSGLGVSAGKGYTGRIVLAGSPGCKVTVTLIWGKDLSAHQSITIDRLSSKFTKYPLKFETSATSEDARLQVTGTGTGSFEIGAVSLMPADNVEGFRAEIVGVLKQLNSGVYRFPGGNYVSAFEWRDAIGDPDKRAPKFDPVWTAVQPNDVGTDEFLKFCQLINVEPYISVNAGFGDAWSAKEYVEYCNGSVTTPMGRWRAANGHKKPYHVKFWGIGNEAWGYSYQFGAMRLSQYEAKHNQFAEAMRSVDPTITLIGSGAMADTMTGSKESLNLGDTLIPKPLGPADWTGGLFAHCLENMDLISEHFYNYGATHYDLSKAQQIPNDPEESLSTWMRRPANHIRLKVEEYKAYEELLPSLKAKPVPICLDEWAYSGGPPNSYKVVPAYAWALHEMFRNSGLYRMACFTFATAMYSANRSEAVLNPTGLMFKLYREHFGSIPVEVTGNSPQPKRTDPVGGEQPDKNAGSDTYPLDVVAAWTADHKALTIAIINTSESDQELDLRISNTTLSPSGTLWRIAPSTLTAIRDVSGKREVEIETSTVQALPDHLKLPKFSISIYAFPVK